MIKNFVRVFVVSLLIVVGELAAPAIAFADPVVMLPPFENFSRQREQSVQTRVSMSVGRGSAREGRGQAKVDRFGEAARTMVEDALVNGGIDIVERQKLDHLLRESEFFLNSGVLNVDLARKAAKGRASHILIGTIVSLSTETEHVNTRYIKAKITKYIAKVRVRLVNVDTAAVVLSMEQEGVKKVTSTTHAKKAVGDAYISAIKNATKAMLADDLARSISRI